jgi:hypothetical protein
MLSTYLVVSGSIVTCFLTNICFYIFPFKKKEKENAPTWEHNVKTYTKQIFYPIMV